MLTGRVLTVDGTPLSEANISLTETPYNILAQTNISGHFKALGVCASAQDLLLAKAGFVPVKKKANVLTSTTAAITVKLEIAGTCLLFHYKTILYLPFSVSAIHPQWFLFNTRWYILSTIQKKLTDCLTD